MPNKKNVFEAVLKKVVQTRTNSYDKRLTHPVGQWLTGLAVFAVIIIAGTAQSIHDFLNYQNVNTENGVYQGTIPHLQEAQAQKVLEVYTGRLDAYKQLQSKIVTDATSTISAAIQQPASSTPETNIAATTTPKDTSSIIVR